MGVTAGRNHGQGLRRGQDRQAPALRDRIGLRGAGRRARRASAAMRRHRTRSGCSISLAHDAGKLSLDDLPGINDDPLKKIREENGARREQLTARSGDTSRDRQASPAKPKVRAMHRLPDIGLEPRRQPGRDPVARDRQQGSLDRHGRFRRKRKLVNQHRLTDPAWINWNFNDFGWSRTVARCGICPKRPAIRSSTRSRRAASAKALTSGKFEISEPGAVGRWPLVLCARQRRGTVRLRRLSRGARAAARCKRITSFKGLDDFALSPDGSQLAAAALDHLCAPATGRASMPTGGERATLTDTRTPEYKALAWPELDIVAVPSTHVERADLREVLQAGRFRRRRKKYPAVLFVHGAGYLQNIRSELSELFPRADVPQPAHRTRLCRARHGLPRLGRLWPRLAHGDLSPDGPSRTRRPDRRRQLAGADAVGRSASASASTAAPTAAS